MTFWTPAQDKDLKRLYAEGYSCSLIAAQIPGKTRNAVIGRVHRLGLSLRGIGKTPPVARPRITNPIGTRKISRKPPVVRPPLEEIKLRCAAVEPMHRNLMDMRRGQCRWPFGSGPYLFCGHPIAHGSSYCEAHFLLSIGPGTSSEQAALKISRRRLEGAW